jgi:broad specificity phosphatase PhoE
MNNTPETRSTLRVHLIRCAGTNNQFNDVIPATRDTISDLGKKQVDALTNQLLRDKPHIDIIYHSPLPRAVQTHKRLLKAFPAENQSRAYREMFNIVLRMLRSRSKTITRSDDRLSEINRGSLGGSPRSQAYTADVLRQMHHFNMDYRFPEGESMHEVAQRMQDWLKEVSADAVKHNWSSVVAITHAIAIKCLLQRVIGLDPRTTWMHDLDHTSITTIELVGEDWRLIRFNATPHLSPEW